MKNVFCYDNLKAVGGIEEFFYQIAKKYKDYDITLYYRQGDKEQIRRLKKYIRCVQYKGEKIKCDKAFFNYYASMIDNVEAKEYALIIHANYKAMVEQGIISKSKIPTYTKINKYYGVSKVVCDSFEKLTGIKPTLVYNPFEVDKPKKILQLISTTRLTKEKGLDNIIKLGNKLDQYCEKTGNDYEWLIFTDDIVKIDNPRIIFLKSRLDVEPFIKKSDYLVQLSKHEAYCYAVVKSLCLGTPVIVTDMPVMKEIGVNKDNGIILDFDLDNIPMKDIFENKYNFKYEPKASNWDKVLAKGNSTYQEDIKAKYEVEALDTYSKHNVTDNVLGRVPKKGEKFKVDYNRLQTLLGDNDLNRIYVKLIKKV